MTPKNVEATTTTINTNPIGESMTVSAGNLLIIPAPYTVEVDSFTNYGIVIVMPGATLTDDMVIDTVSNWRGDDGIPKEAL